MSTKPYEDRTDLGKCQSQWRKLQGLHSRAEWSMAIVRAATAAEIAANYAIRAEFNEQSELPKEFVDTGDRRAGPHAAGAGAGRTLVWTYREAMIPPSFPKSLLVVGSGAIGIEFASFYRTLGADVTVVEVLDRVLPVEDEEISAFAAKAFTKQGMKLKIGTQVTELKKGADNVTCTLKDKAAKPKTSPWTG